MGSTVFRNPKALSSALAALGTLQPRAFGFLNTVDPLVSVSNYYLLYACYIVAVDSQITLPLTVVVYMYVCKKVIIVM